MLQQEQHITFMHLNTQLKNLFDHNWTLFSI